MFQMTTIGLKSLEAQLAEKAASGNGLAHEVLMKLRACSNDAERIEYLRGIVEQAQQAMFWAKEFVAKWERRCLKREKAKERKKEADGKQSAGRRFKNFDAKNSRSSVRPSSSGVVRDVGAQVDRGGCGEMALSLVE